MPCTTERICGRCGGPAGEDFVGLVAGKEVRIKRRMCDQCLEEEAQRELEERERAVAEAVAEREREVRGHYARHALRAGIPPVYHGADLGRIDVDAFNRDAVAAARAYLQDPRGFLLLHGDAGRGKTWLAAAVARDLLVRGGDVEFIRAVDLLDRVREGYHDPEARHGLDWLKRQPILIIDDLGGESLTDWAAETFFNLIDYRYAWERGTVITSNLSGSELARTLGARVASRIKGRGRMVELRGPDRRLGAG